MYKNSNTQGLGEASEQPSGGGGGSGKGMLPPLQVPEGQTPRLSIVQEGLRSSRMGMNSVRSGSQLSQKNKPGSRQGLDSGFALPMDGLPPAGTGTNSQFGRYQERSRSNSRVNFEEIS